MEGSRSFKGFLVLAVYFMLLQGTDTLRWTHSQKNGSTLYHCVGDDVTFRWSYVTEPSERVVATFLYSERNGTLVTGFANRVLTSSPRVTYLPNASMTLSGLTSDDAGTYGIHVRLYWSPVLLTQTVNLAVLEPPKLADDKLKVDHVTPEDAPSVDNNNNNNNNNNNKTCGSGGKLRCGPFITLGKPPVSVVWTDPDEEEFTNSAQENGYFLLDLPASFKGGNYTCHLVLKPEVSQCLRKNRPFMKSASIFLETTETKVEEQEEELQELKDQLGEIRTQTSKLERSQSSRFMHNVLNRVRVLEDTAANITEELDTQKTHAKQLEASTLQMTEDLKQSFHRAFVASEIRTNRTVRDHVEDLSGRLGQVSDDVSDHKDAFSNQQGSIDALQRQLDSLQNQFQNQLNLSSQLRIDLAAAHSSLERHQSQIAALQDKVQQQEEDRERQRQINSDQQKTNAEQLQMIANLQSNMSSTVQRLEQEEALSANLQTQLNRQQENHDDHRETLAQQDTRLLASIQNSTRMLKNITDHLENRLTDKFEECDKKVMSVRDLAENLEKNVTVLFSKADSRFDSVQRSLNNTWRNLTTSLLTLETEQLRMSSSLNESAQVQQKLTELEERLDSQPDQVDSVQLQSLTSNVAGLQQNLSSLRSQCQSALNLGGRVDSLSQKLQPIRLVGGRNEREGRVEIRVGERWGTVCDDGWDNNDAKVVCNMLGYFASGARAMSSAHFGEGTGRIVLDDVNCDGSEQSIVTCSARSFGSHNCGHGEDAGVVCVGY